MKWKCAFCNSKYDYYPNGGCRCIHSTIGIIPDYSEESKGSGGNGGGNTSSKEVSPFFYYLGLGVFLALVILVINESSVSKIDSTTNEVQKIEYSDNDSSTPEIERYSYSNEVLNEVYGLIRESEQDSIPFMNSCDLQGEVITNISKFEIVKLLERVSKSDNGQTDKNEYWYKARYRETEGFLMEDNILRLETDLELGITQDVPPIGLALRNTVGKEIDNEILRIPNNVIVIIRETNLKTETIQGKIGNWIRVDYHGIQGYVFDPYISKISTKSSFYTDSP